MPADILIVDGDPNHLKRLSSILTEKHHRWRPAASGARALAMIQKEPPDLVLLDVMMPDMDGYEVCRQLKQNPETRGIPIILISTPDEAFDKLRAFDAGAADYVTKPIQAAEVLARIESRLLIQAQTRQLAAEAERREALESSMHQSQALLSTVLHVATDGIMAFEAIRDDAGRVSDFRWILLNAAAAHLLGSSVDELSGQSLLASFPDADVIGLFADCVAVLDKGQPLAREYYLEFAKSWIQLGATRRGDGLTVAFRDITRAKEVEQELERLANLDGLTQIANRRVFDETLQREWKRCNRNQLPLTVLLCDVDFFKRFNDTYGHLVGDACLIQVANALCQVVRRPGDLVARYGGEEFAVILSETSLLGARTVAENICAAIEKLSIEHPALEQPVHVTLSIGLASWVPGNEQKPEVLLEAADTALYHSKDQGRNRVTICDA